MAWRYARDLALPAWRNEAVANRVCSALANCMLLSASIALMFSSNRLRLEVARTCKTHKQQTTMAKPTAVIDISHVSHSVIILFNSGTYSPPPNTHHLPKTFIPPANQKTKSLIQIAGFFKITTTRGLVHFLLVPIRP